MRPNPRVIADLYEPRRTSTVFSVSSAMNMSNAIESRLI